RSGIPFMSWIDKIVPTIIRSEGRETRERRSSVPEGLWKKCPKCEAVLYRPELERYLDVCPKCDHHMSIGASRRRDAFPDEAGRPTQVQGCEALQGSSQPGPEGDRREGRAGGDAGHPAEPAAGDGRLRVQLPRRFDGLRGGGEVHPRRQCGAGGGDSPGLLRR